MTLEDGTDKAVPEMSVNNHQHTLRNIAEERKKASHKNVMAYISAVWEMFKASTRIEISMPLDRYSRIHVTAKVKPLDADSVHYLKYSVSGQCHNGKGKGKVHPRRGHEGPGVEDIALLFH